MCFKLLYVFDRLIFIKKNTILNNRYTWVVFRKYSRESHLIERKRSLRNEQLVK